MSRVSELEDYARSWMRLIEKYGGVHHGYFRPPRAGEAVPDAAFSFPGLGREGPRDVAVAMFSFPDVDAYERYRREVSSDPDCLAATARFEKAPWFRSYERTFLVPVAR
jgi:hypothetical protein